VIANRSIVMDGGLEGLEKFTRQTAKRCSFWPERHYYDVPGNVVRMPTFLGGIVIAAL